MGRLIDRKKRGVGGKREMDTGETINSCQVWPGFKRGKKLTEPSWFGIHSNQH